MPIKTLAPLAAGCTATLLIKSPNADALIELE